MEKDDKVFDLIKLEEKRQLEGLELIASENFVSPQILEANGSVLTNKYAEGYPNKRYYAGCEIVDQIEQLAIDRAKLLFGAEWVNVQPHSGSQANTAVYHTFLKPGDSFLGFDLSHGGHLTHGSTVNFSGKLYKAHFYGVDRDSGILDYESINAMAKKIKPKMIIAGASAYSRDIDYKRFRAIADEIGAILWADIAHPCGLIVKGLLNNPVPHCHVVTTTTHKTLRGSRGGMIILGKDFENWQGIKTPKGKTKMISNMLDSAVFPGIQGGPLEHIIAAKAITYKEALQNEFYDYALQVKKNADALGKQFKDRGYHIISGGTENHMILLDLRNKDITGKLANDTLEKSGITVNKNMVPFDDKSPFVTSGIRIGTSAVTTRGMKENDMETIAAYIDEVLSNIDDEKKQHGISEKVKALVSGFPLFAWT